ncbi:MAG: hypothetical protein JW884_00490, partial [Deltaproteobacteria bacterium]|nr:hypothetical protein [Deltaproteobacteria bacterium]
PIINGTPGIDIPRVNPDPLGALDPTSTLGQKFQDVITNNDNNTVPGLTGNTSIDLGNGETMTLTAGDYFLTDIVLRNGSILEIDATGGPVNIYLSGTLDTEDGELEAKNGSQINNQSLPTDFYIYSNSSQSIILKHGSDLSGMVYAPNAPVEIRNSGDVYGLVWGKTIDIKNSGQYFFDIAFKDKFTSNNYDINVASWKDTRYKRN